MGERTSLARHRAGSRRYLNSNDPCINWGMQGGFPDFDNAKMPSWLLREPCACKKLS